MNHIYDTCFHILYLFYYLYYAISKHYLLIMTTLLNKSV